MTRKTAYNVTLRRHGSGEEQTVLSLSDSPERAGEHAIEQARSRLKVMADRQYAQFDIVSCVAAAPGS